MSFYRIENRYMDANYLLEYCLIIDDIRNESVNVYFKWFPSC